MSNASLAARRSSASSPFTAAYAKGTVAPEEEGFVYDYYLAYDDDGIEFSPSQVELDVAAGSDDESYGGSSAQPFGVDDEDSNDGGWSSSRFQ